MKNKYKWCKTCIANEWYPLKPPMNYRKTSCRTLIVSSKLLQDTITNAIREWATNNEAVDKFGDIELRETQDDINEVAGHIRREIRRLIL